MNEEQKEVMEVEEAPVQTKKTHNKNASANCETFDWNTFENELDVYQSVGSKETAAEAYDKTLSNVQVGEVVEGTVIGLNKREVVVNIGYKSDGIIAVTLKHLAGKNYAASTLDLS
jgi:hypothetical protein